MRIPSLISLQFRWQNKRSSEITQPSQSEARERLLRPRHCLEESEIWKNEILSEDKHHCLFHNCDGHDLNECKAFDLKTFQEKVERLKRTGLCFRCLLPRHVAKDCKPKDITCSLCDSDLHRPMLHRAKKKETLLQNEDQKKKDVTSTCTEICQDGKAQKKFHHPK